MRPVRSAAISVVPEPRKEVQDEIADFGAVFDSALDEAERLHGRVRLGGAEAVDAPDVVLVAVAAPVAGDAFAPAEPDRLVLALIVRAAQDKAVLRPDDRVAPVGTLLLQNPGNQGPFLRAQT